MSGCKLAEECIFYFFFFPAEKVKKKNKRVAPPQALFLEAVIHPAGGGPGTLRAAGVFVQSAVGQRVLLGAFVPALPGQASTCPRPLPLRQKICLFLVNYPSPLAARLGPALGW